MKLLAYSLFLGFNTLALAQSETPKISITCPSDGHKYEVGCKPDPESIYCFSLIEGYVVGGLDFRHDEKEKSGEFVGALRPFSKPGDGGNPIFQREKDKIIVLAEKSENSGSDALIAEDYVFKIFIDKDGRHTRGSILKITTPQQPPSKMECRDL